MVECPWRSVNKLVWPQRSFRRYSFYFLQPRYDMLELCFTWFVSTFKISSSMTFYFLCSSKPKPLSLPPKERRYYFGLKIFHIRYTRITWRQSFFLMLNCIPQRGKTVPEELVRAEDLSKYNQVASHAVSVDLISLLLFSETRLERQFFA